MAKNTVRLWSLLFLQSKAFAASSVRLTILVMVLIAGTTGCQNVVPTVTDNSKQSPTKYKLNLAKISASGGLMSGSSYKIIGRISSPHGPAESTHFQIHVTGSNGP